MTGVWGCGGYRVTGLNARARRAPEDCHWIWGIRKVLGYWDVTGAGAWGIMVTGGSGIGKMLGCRTKTCWQDGDRVLALSWLKILGWGAGGVVGLWENTDCWLGWGRKRSLGPRRKELVNDHCVWPFFSSFSITALCCASGLEATPGMVLGPFVTSVQPSLGTAARLSSPKQQEGSTDS